MTRTPPIDALVDALQAVGVADDLLGSDLTDPELSFASLDLDSLAIIEIVARLEDQCGLVVADDEVAELHGPADLLRRLDASAVAAD